MDYSFSSVLLKMLTSVSSFSDDFYFAHLSSEHRSSCSSSCQTLPSCSGDSILIALDTQSKDSVSYLGKKLINDASVEQ